MPFCPRSYFSLGNLKKVIKNFSDAEIVVDKSFFFYKEGKIYFPPFIEFENNFLTGFFLSSEKILNFLRVNSIE